MIFFGGVTARPGAPEDVIENFCTWLWLLEVTVISTATIQLKTTHALQIRSHRVKIREAVSDMQRIITGLVEIQEAPEGRGTEIMQGSPQPSTNLHSTVASRAHFVVPGAQPPRRPRRKQLAFLFSVR